MITPMREKFAANQNCLQLQEYICTKCSFNFLTDSRAGELKCPACGCALEAHGTIVLARTKCTHKIQTDSHEYSPAE